MTTNERRLDGARQGAEVPAVPVPERTSIEDPYVLKVRREISDLDNSLVALVNKRLKLVAQLKRYKDEHGIGFVDLAREEWMLQYLSRGNRGPLSPEGLSELYHYVLDLTKQEILKSSA
jgi:chorismate mutase